MSIEIPALIAELREHAQWSDMPICGTAADVIDEQVRVLKELREYLESSPYATDCDYQLLLVQRALESIAQCTSGGAWPASPPPRKKELSISIRHELNGYDVTLPYSL